MKISLSIGEGKSLELDPQPGQVGLWLKTGGVTLPPVFVSPDTAGAIADAFDVAADAAKGPKP
jgi:hypothetical protein